MTTPRILPVRPSLESLRKQAKKLARDIAAGNADAVARARAQLPRAEWPLSQRDAQLVLAREYGFAGWQHLREEVLKRTGNSLEWAGAQAERAIHDNDLERLKQLLAEYPALLSWRDDSGGSLVSAAATSFGDSGDAYREQMFTRRACAELLIDAGAVVDPLIWESVISSRAKGMLQLLWNKGVLPRTLTILTALGDLDGVRACFDESGVLRAGPGNADGLATVNEAFMCACRFQHKAVASFLLERCIALDIDLGRRIDGWQGRSAFIEYLVEHPQGFGSPWQTFVMNEVNRTIHDDDLPAFVRWLQREPYLLSEASVRLQVELLENATLNNRGPFITQLLDLDPAVRHCRTPPQSSALGFALEYGHAHLVPLLTRIWPLPDDLPHAAGVGDFPRVKRWFDAAGSRRRRTAGAGRPQSAPPGEQSSRARQSSLGYSQSAASARRCARLGVHEPSFRDRFVSARAWSRHQHELEHTRARQHAPRMRHARQLRCGPIPRRSRYRHDQARLPLERHSRGLGTSRREGRTDGRRSGCGRAGKEREQSRQQQA